MSNSKGFNEYQGVNNTLIDKHICNDDNKNFFNIRMINRVYSISLWLMWGNICQKRGRFEKITRVVRHASNLHISIKGVVRHASNLHISIKGVVRHELFLRTFTVERWLFRCFTSHRIKK